MAKSKDNVLTKGLSGTIGRALTFRQRAGKTVISKFLRPTSIPPTEKLQAVRTKFASCIAYAKAAIKDPIAKAIYQAAAKGGQTAFNVATSDALKRPELTKMQSDSYRGTPENENIVQAADDFKMVAVKISIHQATGELLEQGNASIQPGTDWLYRSTNANQMHAGSRITFIATDMHGNALSFSIILT